jgi:uncharacterized protein DUF5317
MFLLYAVAIGLVVGLALSGRLGGLGSLEFRWAPLAIAGFAAQVILFSGPVSDRVGDAGPILYVASTATVLAVVLRNVRLPGLAIVALGAGANLAAIIANGGFMPASPAALVAAGRVAATTYSNSAVIDTPALGPLTDVFALPQWLPLSNVFSIGDVLIGLGVVVAIGVTMRTGAASAPADGDGAPGNLPHPRTSG